jgi:hypothetical protein
VLSCKTRPGFWYGSTRELQLVREQERCAISSKGGERVLEADLWLSEPYMEMISEVVSRWNGRRLRSSRCSEPLTPLLFGSLEKLGSSKPG